MIEFKKHKIAVVIPYYNASNHIVKVISKLPEFVSNIYLVNDKSPDVLPIKELEGLPNFNSIKIIDSEKNLGVGGATKTGFLQAVKDDMDFVIKVDSDDQMDTSYIPDLLNPLILDKADYAKGNRFRDFKALQKMPITRKSGNLFLSFLTKIATGYWNNFDPTNGFFALKTSFLKNANFKNISNRYYFETSLLSEMYFQNARIKDVPMPAIYGDEKSSMKVWTIPFIFTPKLLKTLIKRILKTYFIYDFNMSSIYILLGIPMFFFGVIFGLYNWWYYTSVSELTPTGTIMLITLSIILGFQLLLQAIHYDIMRTPKAE